MPLKDGRWAALAPLIEQVRPGARTPMRHLRRTVEAIVRRHSNGAKRRAVPADLGPWWAVARTFVRWVRLGVWTRLLGLVARRAAQLGVAFLDGTSIRAHHKAAGGPKKGPSGRRNALEALGRPRGGYGTKACVVADASGHAVAFALLPGQAHELPHAVPLLGNLPEAPKWVVADRGYSSHAFGPGPRQRGERAR